MKRKENTKRKLIEEGRQFELDKLLEKNNSN